MKSLNTYMKEKVGDNPNLSVPFYLCACYAYYEMDRPFLTDSGFDWLSKFLTKRWSVVRHRHKDYLNMDMIKAGTFLGDYPSIIPGATNQLYLTQKERK